MGPYEYIQLLKEIDRCSILPKNFCRLLYSSVNGCAIQAQFILKRHANQSEFGAGMYFMKRSGTTSSTRYLETRTRGWWRLRPGCGGGCWWQRHRFPGLDKNIIRTSVDNHHSKVLLFLSYFQTVHFVSWIETRNWGMSDFQINIQKGRMRA